MAQGCSNAHGPRQHSPAGHDQQKAQGHNPGDRHGLASANALLPPRLGPLKNRELLDLELI